MTDLWDVLETPRMQRLGPEIGVYVRAVRAARRGGFQSVQAVRDAPDAMLLASCHHFGPGLLGYLREMIDDGFA